VNVPQCGYCQSGTNHAGDIPLKSAPHPADQEIDDAMAGNICRCGTYQRVRSGDQTGSGENRMSPIENVSRRRFLKGVFGAGALVLCHSVLPPLLTHGHATDELTDGGRATFHPNLFVGIQQDELSTSWPTAQRWEQLFATSLPLVLADELDADWNRVKIDQAIGDKRYGDQNTDGFALHKKFFRHHARVAALQPVGCDSGCGGSVERSGVECSTEPHTVFHKATGRRLGYGELASKASHLTVPKGEQLRLESIGMAVHRKGMTSG